MSATWKAILGVILVFVLGCAAGALASSAVFVHRNTLFFQRGAPAYVDVLERRLTRGLQLDADQKSQIHDAFMDNLEQRKKLQSQIQPQVRELNQQTFRQIKSILHPDQMDDFQKNLDDLHRRFGRFGVANPHTLDTDSPQAANAPPAAPAANP